MVTIDLTTPPAPAASFLDGLARGLALTLPELAELAGPALRPRRAPYGGSRRPVGRLGQSRGSVEDTA